MLNGDEKSVVRLSIEVPVAVLATGRVPLAPRLSVRPVLGYDAAYERTLAALRDELGLQPAKRSLYDDAVRAGGRQAARRRDEGAGDARARHAHRCRGRRSSCAAWPRSRRRTSPGAVEDLDPEFLHDLRVSIRRARAVLRELRGVLEPRERARLRDELKWAQALTGPVRDLDVQLLEWPAPAAGAAARAPELEPLRALLERRRARERAKLVRGLRSARFAGCSRPGGRWPTAGGRREGHAAARCRSTSTAGGRIVKVYRADGARRPGDRRGQPAEALHDLRKRGKELRYLLELFGGAFEDEVVEATSRRSRACRPCSAASRTGPCRSSRCARCATSSPASRTAPRR